MCQIKSHLSAFCSWIWKQKDGIFAISIWNQAHFRTLHSTWVDADASIKWQHCTWFTWSTWCLHGNCYCMSDLQKWALLSVPLRLGNQMTSHIQMQCQILSKLTGLEAIFTVDCFFYRPVSSFYLFPSFFFYLDFTLLLDSCSNLLSLAHWQAMALIGWNVPFELSQSVGGVPGKTWIN